ncbi:hypothetical protein QJQ45_020304 [Haematococcus lacustris]|nr:hypothetical protein QJQ45_020304 [Haematococcus lacustris]
MRVMQPARSQAAASEPRPITHPPAKHNKRTQAERAAEPTQPTKGTDQGKGKAAEPNTPAPQPSRRARRHRCASNGSEIVSASQSNFAIPATAMPGHDLPQVGKKETEKHENVEKKRPARSQAAASEPRPITHPPAKHNKRTQAERAAEPTQPTKGTDQGKGKAAEPNTPAPQPSRRARRHRCASNGSEIVSASQSNFAIPATAMPGHDLPQVGKKETEKHENVEKKRPARSQAAASEPRPITHPPAKHNKRTQAERAAEPTQPTKGTDQGKGKAAEPNTPAPQPSRWVDRDCNTVMVRQRIGEARWRPLKLC